MTMDRKEEILKYKNIGQNNTWLKATVDHVKEAMEVYAKEQAIAFASFLGEIMKGNIPIKIIPGIVVEWPELYEKFIEYQSHKQIEP